MAKIGSWGGHNFEVKRSLARSFTDLTVKGGSETENKANNKQQFAVRKAGKPLEIGMTVVLDSRLGVDAQTDALRLIDQARMGHKSYFYLDGKKLTPCQLMLTSASADNILLTASGEWVSVEVKLTMVQCSKNDGSAGVVSSGGGGTKKKVTVKKPAKPSGGAIGSTVIQAVKPGTGSFGTALSNIANAAKQNAAKTAQAAINQVNQSAKKNPLPARLAKALPVKGGGGGIGSTNKMAVN